MSLENVLRDYGLEFTSLTANGDIQRCGTKKHPRSRNGWYIIYDNGESACYGNWENGEGFQYWRGDNAELKPIDKERIEAMKAARAAAYEEAAKRAQAYIETACKKDGESAYLAKKKVKAHGALFDKDALLLPCQDANGKIWSYQRIMPDGAKYFMAQGKTKGCYFSIFPEKAQVKYTDRVIVCEGFATGASIHEATGKAVFVAFSAGNLKTVADSLPYRNILIAADNDESGTGLAYAKASGYPYVMPTMRGDFNDAACMGHDISFDFDDKPVVAPDVIEAHGLVGDIANWITRTASRPQPMLSLAAAIAFVGMMKGHRVKGRTNLRTNVLCLALAPTGGGKEHPQYCISELARLAKLDKKILGEPVSGTGFLNALIKADRVGLMIMDEMARYLGNLMQKGTGSYQKEIIDYIIKTFSSANRIMYGKVYANEKQNPQININQPHFCCLGSTVPEKLIASCTSSEIVDGFLNRWLLFQSKDRPAKQMGARYEPPPEELVERVIANSGAINDRYGEPSPQECRFTPEAWNIFMDYGDRMEELTSTAPYPLPALYNRSCEHAEKIAMILAQDEIIGVNDIKVAIQIVERSNKHIMHFAGMVSDNTTEAEFVRVRKIIMEAGEISRNELSRQTQFLTGGKRRRDEILDSLVEQDLITVMRTDQKVAYRWKFQQ